MNKKIILLSGVLAMVAGVSSTILFDVQPQITFSITMLGAGVIAVTLLRNFSDRHLDNE